MPDVVEGNMTSTKGGSSMNADQFKGRWKQFKGDLKMQWGKFTDDDLRQIEGSYDKFVGKIQERYGDRKDELMKWAAQWYERFQHKTEEAMGQKTR